MASVSATCIRMAGKRMLAAGASRSSLPSGSHQLSRCLLTVTGSTTVVKKGSHELGIPKDQWDGVYEDSYEGDLSKEQVTKIGLRAQEQWLDHIRLNTNFAPGADGAFNMESGTPQQHDRDLVRRKRLIYRSKQRGWLEVDLLLGSWAQTHVMGLTTAQMDEYEGILNCETVDIYHFITEAKPVPTRFDTTIMKTLQAYSRSNPFGNACPTQYAETKRRLNLT